MFCVASHVKPAWEEPQHQAFLLPVVFSAPLLQEQMVASAWDQHPALPAACTQPPPPAPKHAQLQTQSGPSKWHSPNDILANFSLDFIRKKKRITHAQGKENLQQLWKEFWEELLLREGSRPFAGSRGVRKCPQCFYSGAKSHSVKHSMEGTCPSTSLFNHLQTAFILRRCSLWPYRLMYPGISLPHAIWVYEDASTPVPWRALPPTCAHSYSSTATTTDQRRTALIVMGS